MSAERYKAMQKINGRTKGSVAEREAAAWLQRTFKLQDTPQRNLEQVRSGGHDLLGFPPFAVEIKRQEKLDLRGAWVQVVNAADINEVPFVMYRKSRQKWHFLVSAKPLGLKNGFVRLEEREFILWAQAHINSLYL